MSKGLASVKTLTAKEIANKWKLPLAVVAKKIAAGVKVEKEHTTSTRQANEIARDHLGERPDYYDKLNKMEKTKVVKEMVSSVVQSWPNSKNIEDNRSTTGKDFASKVYHGASVVGQAYSNIKNKISPPEKPNMNPKAEPLPSSYGGKALPSKDGGSTGTGVQKDNEMSIKNIGTASNDYLTSTSISGGDRKSPATPSNKSYTPTPGSGTSTPTTPRQAPIKEPDEVVNAQGSVFDRMNKLKEENVTGAVRGLGFVTGDPGVNYVDKYINTNAMSYTDWNGNILKMIRDNHNKHLKDLGFNSFSPNDIQSNVNRIVKEAKINEIGDFVKDGMPGYEGTSAPIRAVRKRDVKEQSPANISYKERPMYERSTGNNPVPAGAERGIYEGDAMKNAIDRIQKEFSPKNVKKILTKPRNDPKWDEYKKRKESQKKQVKEASAEKLQNYTTAAAERLASGSDAGDRQKEVNRITGINTAVRKLHPEIYPGEIKVPVNEISAELVGRFSNARFWRKESPSKTLTRAINKKFIELGTKKEPKKETKMDTKELINEALDNILEDNLSEMKDNLMLALQEKAMEKLEERKKEIAAQYFAQ